MKQDQLLDLTQGTLAAEGKWIKAAPFTINRHSLAPTVQHLFFYDTVVPKTLI